MGMVDQRDSPEVPHWISVEAAARILRISGRTIRIAIRRGNIARFRRVGFGSPSRRRYYVVLDDVRRAMETESREKADTE